MMQNNPVRTKLESANYITLSFSDYHSAYKFGFKQEPDNLRKKPNKYYNFPTKN